MWCTGWLCTNAPGRAAKLTNKSHCYRPRMRAGLGGVLPLGLHQPAQLAWTVCVSRVGLGGTQE